MIKYKELKQKSKELERKYQLNHYELLQRFMFERILERIYANDIKFEEIIKELKEYISSLDIEISTV